MSILMHLHVTEPVESVEYADDTFSFAAIGGMKVGTIQLESVTEKLVMLFESHQLNLNATGTEFIIFSKNN